MALEPGSLQFVLNELNRFTEKQVKAVTLDAVANLVETTPRRTGWARSNWLPSIGQPADVDGTAPSEDRAAASAASRAALGQQGIAQIVTTYKLSMGKIYVTNNVPYIAQLNEGSSTQAPAGFVQAAILKAVRKTFS